MEQENKWKFGKIELSQYQRGSITKLIDKLGMDEIGKVASNIKFLMPRRLRS